ncbi:MAG: hypothetical protein JWR33_1398 [Naasia sp.]|jgi:hypothetical protein|nr:hypothetical protein [Naasia sp.]
MAPHDILGFTILLVSGSAMVLGLVRQFGPTLRRRRN